MTADLRAALDVLARYGFDKHERFCVPARECTCRHLVYRDVVALASTPEPAPVAEGLDVELLENAFTRSEAGERWGNGASIREIATELAREYAAASPSPEPAPVASPEALHEAIIDIWGECEHNGPDEGAQCAALASALVDGRGVPVGDEQWLASILPRILLDTTNNSTADPNGELALEWGREVAREIALAAASPSPETGA